MTTTSGDSTSPRPAQDFVGVAALLAPLALPDEVAAVLMRVSAQNRKEMAENVRTATDRLGHLPGVAFLAGLDLWELISDQSLAGEGRRQQLGVVPIRRANAHRFALEPGRLMGYLMYVPEAATLIVMIFDSAGELTVRNPFEPLPGNAVAALISQICLMREVHRLHVTEWSRWVRDPRFGAEARAAAQIGRVDVYDGRTLVDTITPSGTTMAGLRDGNAASERHGTRLRTTVGTLSKLNASEMIWPYSPQLLPPGYQLDFERQRDARGISQRTSYVRAATGAQAAGWQNWAEAVAAGETFLAAGRHLAKARIRARGQRHTRPDGSVPGYHELTALQLARGSRSLAGQIDLLRSGYYLVAKSVPIPVRRGDTFEGYVVDHDEPGDNGFGVIRLRIQLPPSCINLTEEQWDSWERRIHGRTPRSALREQYRAPFADVRQQWWHAEGGQARGPAATDWTVNWRVAKNAGSYEVFSRSREDALDARGQLRGWEPREGAHRYTMRREDFDAGYARAGAAAALAHLEAWQPVTLPSRPLPDLVQAHRRNTERLAALPELIQAAADAVEDAELVSAKAAERGRGQQQAAEALALAQANRDQLVQEQECLRTSVAAPPEPEVVETLAEVDLATPARLFAVLETMAGQLMPHAVNDLLHRLSHGRLRITPDPDLPRMLRVTDVLDWPTRGGDPVPLHISFIIENRKRDTSQAERDQARRHAAAALILRDGHTVDQAAAALACSRGDALRAARSWLKAHHPAVPSRGARSAILDCPVPEAKAAVWAALTNRTVRDLAPRYADYIAHCYLNQLCHPNSWITRDLNAERAVLDLMRSLEGQGIDLSAGITADDLADRLGCTPQQVLFLAQGRGPRYRSVLEYVPGSRRLLRPRRCGSGHWLFHIIATPETAAWNGLVCDTCRATPDGTPLPPGYFERWNTHQQPGDLKETPGTFLDATPLPQAPGAAPRRLLLIGEAAAYLKVSTHALREWSNAGLVPCAKRPRRYDPRALDSAPVQQLAARYQERHGPRTGTEDPRLTLNEVCVVLGAPEHYVRNFLIATGRLTPTRGGSRGLSLLFAETDVTVVPTEWRERHAADLLSIGQAAARAGMTTGQLRKATNAGLITCLVTDGGTRRYRPRDLPPTCTHPDSGRRD